MIVLFSQIWLIQINPARATAPVQPLITYTGADASIAEFLCTPSNNPSGGDLANCINKLYRFGIAAGGFILVFFVVLAGYFYMTGGEQSKAKGKTILQNALVGVIILAGSYTLLKFINPQLVVYKPIQPPIFEASTKPSCESLGLGQDCILDNKGGSGGGGGAGQGGVLAGKNVFMFGDSLTAGFATQLQKQISMASFEKDGCGNTKIEDWLNGGTGAGGCKAVRIQDRLSTLKTKPEYIVIMLGTNNARGGVKADSVKSMDQALKDYKAIWIAPPKFPQPSCFKITPEISTAADNAISTNFNSPNHSIFKSAEQNIDLVMGKEKNCSDALSGATGRGYDIHPGDTGYGNWVKAFLGK